MAPDGSVTEASKDALRGFIDAINERRFDELSDDYVEHDRAYTGRTTTLEDARTKMERLDESLSNITITIDDMVAEDERVAASVTASAIHDGEFYGVPPTGEQLEWAATVVARIEDGEVVEAWILRDVFGILQQLGVIEPPQDG